MWQFLNSELADLGRRRWLRLAGLCLVPLSGIAQENDPARGLNVICLASPNPNQRLLVFFKTALHEVDPILAQHTIVTSYFANFEANRLAALARRAIEQQPNLILCLDLDAALAVLEARRDERIPLVFLVHEDPLAHRLIDSYARPGHNVTGINTYGCIEAKMVEIVHDAFPSARRIGFIRDPEFPDNGCHASAEQYALAHNIKLEGFAVAAPETLEHALDQIAKSRPDALIVTATAATWTLRKKLIARLGALALPALYEGQVFVDDGGLMQFSAHKDEVYQRVARMVARVLRGAAAGEIPIEQPMNYELVVNLAAQNAQRYHLSPAILRRADRILE